MNDAYSEKVANHCDESISKMTEVILSETKEKFVPPANSFVLPIGQIASLGSGVSQLIPCLNAITQTSTMNVGGLYRVANAGIGDVLKSTKSGGFWGALKTIDGTSKMAQLAPADPISMTSKISMGVNPAMIMMAVTLYSIEKELGNIADMQKKILTFLETEKEAEIEADVVSLNELISKYKYNWDNERYLSSNHKMVCDIQRASRKNLLMYQKQVAEQISKKPLLSSNGKVNRYFSDLLKAFQYYRLSIFAFSLSSFTEIMLSGNFGEDNINLAISELEKNSERYRELFGECSVFLENVVEGSLGNNVRRVVGTTTMVVGDSMEILPMVKCKPVNDYLVAQGKKIYVGAKDRTNDFVSLFSEVSSPNTGVFINRMKELKMIFSHTSGICFDDNNIYLLT